MIGDGALTGGVAFEDAHNVKGLQTPVVIVLNDNGMSISPNVGALSRYFTSVRLNRRTLPCPRGRRDPPHSSRSGSAGGSSGWAPRSRPRSRRIGRRCLLFEELDLAYVGVVDPATTLSSCGSALTQALERIRPVVVHIHTVKGKGSTRRGGRPRGDGEMARGEAGLDVDRRPAPKKRGVPKPLTPPRESRSVFAREDREAPWSRQPSRRRSNAGLRERARPGPSATSGVWDHRGDGSDGLAVKKLCDALPKQYHDVGIAEQDAVLLAAGLAIQGAKPVCAIYSTFLQRAFDQLVHDVCLQKLNVVFAMDRAGLVGDDGPTHHGAFDVSYFRALPNVVVMAPRDEAMLVHMLRTALAHDGA